MDDPTRYGERFAGVYDDLFGNLEESDDVVTLLASLAGDGPLLELGSGTGRVAIPLARRGVDVHGIEISPAMVEAMRAKPGGEDIPITVGDFRDVEVEGPFRVIAIPFNTLFMLTAQEDQVACFRAVAGRLEPGGVFVVEAFVPDAGRWTDHQATQTRRIEDGRVVLDLARHDPTTQRVDAALVLLGDDGIRTHAFRLRYAWPSELDLMAQIAGLRLRERLGGWDRRPFDSSSQVHISIYERPSAPA